MHYREIAIFCSLFFNRPTAASLRPRSASRVQPKPNRPWTNKTYWPKINETWTTRLPFLLSKKRAHCFFRPIKRSEPTCRIGWLVGSFVHSLVDRSIPPRLCFQPRQIDSAPKHTGSFTHCFLNLLSWFLSFRTL